MIHNLKNEHEQSLDAEIQNDLGYIDLCMKTNEIETAFNFANLAHKKTDSEKFNHKIESTKERYNLVKKHINDHCDENKYVGATVVALRYGVYSGIMDLAKLASDYFKKEAKSAPGATDAFNEMKIYSGMADKYIGLIEKIVDEKHISNLNVDVKKIKKLFASNFPDEVLRVDSNAIKNEDASNKTQDLQYAGDAQFEYSMSKDTEIKFTIPEPFSCLKLYWKSTFL